MYEYTITYYPVPYFIESRDVLTEGARPLGGTAMPTDPDFNAIMENEAYIHQINTMGENGWELVNVAPLLRGCYNELRHYGYSLTAGYYFFWKRKK